ncbi:hypothetical protein GCM10028827_10470 [Mucilaginibacter myungsuensis]|uniref:Organic solvent tolerance-like N-terminal domain-containing protein n=2 Tax=Mucilaginibacter myungsuensis TaxID=649104 RepID=A0A929KZ92_9SPHI|nr:hypothetical protein [Mucilaginibacter myungsuensis]
MASPDLLKVYNGTFTQKYSVLTCDSAYVYTKLNTFDAFGHVVITQGDTLHVYSDKLNYNDNTKIALLTENVKMVEKDAVLTTNWLNYNTATKVGTYIDGGKIVNKENTLTSRNGYYYANTRDVYFRYDVVTNGPDALIRTDTMRYNSGTKITYFYGPTRIFGKKDKDTLYTENGTYNTKTEQAFFGKRNRYSQGTKSLKGDSLFYDKLKGYGKAIRNITFEDTEQRMVLKGHLGEYFRKEEKAVVTQNPYVVLISEEKDTTKKVATVDPAKTPKITDGVSSAISTATTLLPGGKLLDNPASIAGVLPLNKVDSLTKAMGAQPGLKNALTPANIKTADSLAKLKSTQAAIKAAMPLASSKMADSIKRAATKALVTGKAPTVTSAQKKAVTQVVGNFGVAVPAPKPATVKPAPAKAPAIVKYVTPKAPPRIPDPVYTGPDLHLNDPKPKNTPGIKRDTMFIGADTLETRMVTFKTLKELQEKRRLAGIVDPNRKIVPPVVPYTLKNLPKVLETIPPKFPYLAYPPFKERPLPYLPKKDTVAKVEPAKKPDLKPKPKPDPKKIAADSVLKAKRLADSIKLAKMQLPDTARVRILSAHHNVRIFRADLQGRADSLFYSSSDSIIRNYVKPMYWTQGAQLSGDTINLQLKNKKADYMDVFPKSFVVYIEKKDSTHFNQIGGKRIQFWFKENKISRVFVTGNAETIYNKRSDKTDAVTDLYRSISSTLNFNFKNNEMANMMASTKVDEKITPIKEVTEEDKTLKNFIWKPKDRPASKEEIINPPKKPVEPKKVAPKKGTDPAAKPGAKPTTDGKPTGKAASATDKAGSATTAGKDSIKTISEKLVPPKALVDSLNKAKGKPITAPARKDSSKNILGDKTATPKAYVDSLNKEKAKEEAAKKAAPPVKDTTVRKP